MEQKVSPAEAEESLHEVEQEGKERPRVQSEPLGLMHLWHRLIWRAFSWTCLALGEFSPCRGSEVLSASRCSLQQWFVVTHSISQERLWEALETLPAHGGCRAPEQREAAASSAALSAQGSSSSEQGSVPRNLCEDLIGDPSWQMAQLWVP